MICIDADGYYLTHGKEYEILHNDGNYVTVVNDIGRPSDYPIKIFKE